MTHHPDPRPTLGLAALLAFLSMLSPFSIDTFFPSFPAIAQEFSLTALQLQQTLTAYLVPYGVTMLLHGPLSDAYGRRRVILVGVSLFTVASLACALAPGFGTPTHPPWSDRHTSLVHGFPSSQDTPAL